VLARAFRRIVANQRAIRTSRGNVFDGDAIRAQRA
jgi:hypothetical protein